MRFDVSLTSQFSISNFLTKINMKITDENLYELCKKYGTASLIWRQKFTGLLPEVNRRRLYEKKGFSSIFEFAFKLCGLSQDQVHLALNLGRRFEDKPALMKLLEEGEASINKLSRVVSIATVENQEELAEKVKILPKSALETLVRDEKFAMGKFSNDKCENSDGLFGEKNNTNAANSLGEIESRNGLDKPLFEGKSLPGQTFGGGNKGLRAQTLDDGKSIGKNLGDQTLEVEKRSLSFGTDGCENHNGLNFQLAEDVKKELEELNSKGIDVNEFLRKALKQRKEEIEERKEEIARELERNDARTPTKDQQAINQSANETGTKPSRYIPVKVKKIIKEEFGTKCSITNCKKQAEVLHHTRKFALAHCHDPRFLAPLCKEHHLIAHSIDIKFNEKRDHVRLSRATTRHTHSVTIPP